MAAQSDRYTAVAIVLHWAIAIAILFMLPLGYIMHERAEHGDTSQAVFAAYQLHKSIGLTVLALTLVRLAWRLMYRPPPLPDGMPGWERLAARATHWGFYVLTLALPLSGWIYVSAGWSIHEDVPLAVPTRWFNLFQVPHLFDLPHASADVRSATAHSAMTAHVVFAWTAVALAGLHVAAALKHHFVNRDATLTHMVPVLRPPGAAEAAPRSVARSAILGGGFAVITAALIAASFAAAPLMSAPRPESHVEIAEHEDAAPAPALTPSAEHSTATTPQTPAAPPAPGAPSRWTVDQSASSIGFSYVYQDDNGDTRFNGRFTRWNADIQFDPANLDASSIVVRIQTASANTGVAIHDNALPTAPWFNSASFPVAEFRSTQIRSRGGNQYDARGNLTIRGRSHGVTLPFTLTINGAQASVSGSTSIDRRDYGIGADDAGDDLISREIQINVRVEATRAS